MDLEAKLERRKLGEGTVERKGGEGGQGSCLGRVRKILSKQLRGDRDQDRTTNLRSAEG